MNLSTQMDQSDADAAADAVFEARVDTIALELEALLHEQRRQPFLTDEEQYLLAEAIGALLTLYINPVTVPAWKP